MTARASTVWQPAIREFEDKDDQPDSEDAQPQDHELQG